MARQYWIKWATALFLAGALAGACTDDKTNKPSGDLNLGGDESTGGSGAKGGAVGVAGDATGLGGAVGEGGAPATTDVGAAGAAIVSGGAAGLAGATGISNLAGAAGQGADCVDAAKNCFKCAASSNQQILNHCTDAKCIAFDNKILTKLVNGQLPALP